MASIRPNVTFSTPSAPASQPKGYQNSSHPIVGKFVDRPAQVREQAGKHQGKVQRMTLNLPHHDPPLAFNAHIDPQDLVHSAEKRVASLDALSGVVIQDFGYKPETIELRGTTGNRYFVELQQLQNIFRNQNIIDPSPVELIVEERHYQCLWSNFSFQRSINANSGNIYLYTMNFTVLQEGSSFTNNIDKATSTNSAIAVTGAGDITTTINLVGKSIDDYLKEQTPIVTPSNKMQAVAILQKYWTNTTLNGPFPRTSTPLGLEIVTVPKDWKAALANNSKTSGIA